ncbi:hypothetical protein HRE53_22825 [Acaryochloris sp. 'Moss Beach']|uniref:hypothetical protein n=1 Tax=Acaryochloris sp. 'Moss Beach' TaxID=2740837 RepID=UPI001F19843A|nr:hypothetical protein [Acaryochloris sp. 'Moss Beach']UJB69189.1 hypothetical protein HRE53_22825 [Acaryochloris sp. 'Moss Beach']
MEIPLGIKEKLDLGIYERIGGVIRQSGNKKVVAWLRENSNSSSSLPPPFPNSPPCVSHRLLQATTTVNVLNLGLSTMGFAVVLKQLQNLEKRLEDTQDLLSKLNRKVDLTFYANFRAALDLALNAFTMSREDNRRDMAIQAINRFLEAQHIFTGVLDTELAEGSQIADEYLLTLGLAYVAEVRCYLELGEFDSATRRFYEGQSVIRNRTQKYVELLLTSNPSVYLHPKFQDQIDLSKLTQIYRWIDPTMDENAVFNLLRDGIFKWRNNRDKWVESLPPAILIKEEVEGSWFGPNNADLGQEAFNRLPSIFGVIESTIETCQRFATYQTEIHAMTQLGISLSDWEKLEPSETDLKNHSGNIMFLLPDDSVQVTLEV